MIQTEGLELVSNLQCLTACSAVWSSMYMREQLQSAIIHDLTHKLRDQVKAIGNQVVLFFQVRSWNTPFDIFCNLLNYIELQVHNKFMIWRRKKKKNSIVERLVSNLNNMKCIKCDKLNLYFS